MLVRWGAAIGVAAPHRRSGSEAVGPAELYDWERLIRAPRHSTDVEDLRALRAGRELALLGRSDTGEHAGCGRVLLAADVESPLPLRAV